MTKHKQKGRIRGPHLAVLTRYEKRLHTKDFFYGMFDKYHISNQRPFEESIQLVDEQRRVVASNSRVDEFIHSPSPWPKPEWLKKYLWCHTGTMTAYVEPGVLLGSEIEFMDPGTDLKWIFPVPAKFRREKDAVLVVEHPNYRIIQEGDNRIIESDPDKIDIVLGFPGSDGRVDFGDWAPPGIDFPVDPKYGIPTTGELQHPSMRRFLFRRERMVAPIVRGVDGFYGRMTQNAVFIKSSPSCTQKVIVESSDPEEKQVVLKSIEEFAREMKMEFNWDISGDWKYALIAGGGGFIDKRIT